MNRSRLPWIAILPVIAAPLALSGCEQVNQQQSAKPDPLVAEAKQAEANVRYGLKDPDSAKFRNVRRMPLIKPEPGEKPFGTNVYCGEVNAKNAYGAYAGFQKFRTFGSKPEPGEEPSAAIWDESQPGSGFGYVLTCQEDGKDRTDVTPVTFGDPPAG